MGEWVGADGLLVSYNTPTFNYKVAQHVGTTQGRYPGYPHASLLEDCVPPEGRDLRLPNTEFHSWHSHGNLLHWTRARFRRSQTRIEHSFLPLHLSMSNPLRHLSQYPCNTKL